MVTVSFQTSVLEYKAKTMENITVLILPDCTVFLCLYLLLNSSDLFSPCMYLKFSWDIIPLNHHVGGLELYIVFPRCSAPLCVFSSVCVQLVMYEEAYQWWLWNGFGMSWLCLTAIQQQWISELVLSIGLWSQKVFIAAELTAGESLCRNVRLTVAAPPSEKERASRKKKTTRRGRGSGNDLSFPAHENQMFSRTPRHPIFIIDQHPEDPGILNYSRCIP